MNSILIKIGNMLWFNVKTYTNITVDVILSKSIKFNQTKERGVLKK